MAKSPEQRYREHRARLKLKTTLLSDLDRARREDLAEQFSKTTGDPELIAKMREYFMRHPMCFTAPAVVNIFGDGKVVAYFATEIKPVDRAAVYDALRPRDLTVHSRYLGRPTYVSHVHVELAERAAVAAVRARRHELEDAGLWGDDPL